MDPEDEALGLVWKTAEDECPTAGTVPGYVACSDCYCILADDLIDDCPVTGLKLAPSNPGFNGKYTLCST